MNDNRSQCQDAWENCIRPTHVPLGWEYPVITIGDETPCHSGRHTNCKGRQEEREEPPPGCGWVWM